MSIKTSIRMYSIVLTYALFLALNLVRDPSIRTESNPPSCYDENGRQVDWYIAYKFPELSEQSAPFNSGYAYAYITSESVKGFRSNTHDDGTKQDNYFSRRFKSFLKSSGIYSDSTYNEDCTQGNSSKLFDSHERASVANVHWTISDKLITDPQSIIMRTLSIAFNSDGGTTSEINSIFYNDAPAGRSKVKASAHSSRAHAKGVVLMDDVTGKSIWITHSTPQFPPPRSMHLEFYENSKTYGQTFMCIDFDLRQSGKQIIEHLINMYPLVYDSQISERMRTLIPELNELESDKRGRKRKAERKRTTKLAQTINTYAGENLSLYSKSADFGEDLYSGWIDNELKTALYVETWRNGAGTPLNSSCPRDNYRVNNVQDLKIRNQSGEEYTWSYHRDHSKWAISEGKNSAMVCISDINRMRSQFKRGGGAVCIKCPSCWSVFSTTILDLEPCPVAKKS